MRVVIAAEIFLPKRDGVTLDLEKLLRHLKKDGHEVLIFGPAYSVKRIHGLRVLRCPGIPVGLYPGLRCSVVMPDALLTLASFRPDVIFIIDPFFIGTQVLCFAHLFVPSVPILVGFSTNIPYYTTVFGYPHITPVEWVFLKRQHRAAVATVCRSPSTAEELVSRGWDSAKVRIWPGGVDANFFKPEKRDLSIRKTWLCGSADKTVLLYVGRVSWEKNLESLIDVYAPLDKSHFHLVVVGDGPALEEFASFFDPSTVTFTGWLNGDDLAAAFASGDIFVFPSFSETFGNVVVEAMASALPVVAFRSEGVRDSVIDTVTGYLSTVGDANEFRNAIEVLGRDLNLRQRLGHAGRVRVQPWTLDRSVHECENILLQVCLSQGPRVLVPNTDDGKAVVDSCEDRKLRKNVFDRLIAVVSILAISLFHNILGFVSGMWRAARYGQIRANPSRLRRTKLGL